MRRAKIVGLDDEVLLDVLCGYSVFVDGQLPDDVSITGINYDLNQGGFVVRVESKEFDEVQPGMMTPHIYMMMKSVPQAERPAAEDNAQSSQSR